MKAGIYEAWKLVGGDKVASGSVVLDCVAEEGETGFVIVTFRRADGSEDSVRLPRNEPVETV